MLLNGDIADNWSRIAIGIAFRINIESINAKYINAVTIAANILFTDNVLWQVKVKSYTTSCRESYQISAFRLAVAKMIPNFACLQLLEFL